MVSLEKIKLWQKLFSKKYGVEFEEFGEEAKNIKEVSYRIFRINKLKAYQEVVRWNTKTIDLRDCVNMIGLLDLFKLEARTHNKMIDMGIQQGGSCAYSMTLKEMCKIVYTKEEFKTICKSMSSY